MYALLGSAVAWLTAYTLGVDIQSLNLGLYGYNAVLSILAVSLVFDAKSRFAPITGIIAAILTVPMTTATTAILLPYGLPALTMPFVLITWLLLGARKILPNL